MSDRLSSDHPTIVTHRVRVERHGGNGRRLCVSPADVLPKTDTVRILLDGRVRFAPVVPALDATASWLTGVYATPRLARASERTNDLLLPWLAARDIGPGATVLLDVIESDFAYGLREPGTREVYPAVEPPDAGLAAIAQSISQPEEDP